MSNEMQLVRALRQFTAKHPKVDYCNLVGILEHISRITKTSPDTLLAVALVDRQAANYLVRCVANVSKKD
jgi:hypothetical protein